MSEALGIESGLPFVPTTITPTHLEDRTGPENEEPSLTETLDKDSIEPKVSWNKPALVGLNLAGVPLLAAGHYFDRLPPVLSSQIMGYTPIGSFRHYLPASALTLVSELSLSRITSTKMRKLYAFVAGFIPSVLWEIHQVQEGGYFGMGDIATAAAVGGLSVMISTRRREPEVLPELGKAI